MIGFSFIPLQSGYTVRESGSMFESYEIDGGFDAKFRQLADISWLVDATFVFTQSQYNSFISWYDSYRSQIDPAWFDVWLIIDPDDADNLLKSYRAQIVPASVKLDGYAGGVYSVSLQFECAQGNDVLSYYTCDQTSPYVAKFEKVSIGNASVEGILDAYNSVVEYEDATVSEVNIGNAAIESVEVITYAIVASGPYEDNLTVANASIENVNIVYDVLPVQVEYENYATEEVSVNNASVESVEIVEYTVTAYDNYATEDVSINNASVESVEIEYI
jgi:hypothetical protein